MSPESIPELTLIKYEMIFSSGPESGMGAVITSSDYAVGGGGVVFCFFK